MNWRSDRIHEIADGSDVMTPALAIYSDVVEHNILRMIEIVGGVNRWRPHIKTAKLEWTIRRLVEHGLTAVKCATTLELLTACRAGADDILLAYPGCGPEAVRVAEIADSHPAVDVSCLVENVLQVEAWAGSHVGLFVDINPGMNRTGIDLNRVDDIVGVARRINASGLRFRGLHFYDGHRTEKDLSERTAAARASYDQLLRIVGALEAGGIVVEEVITSGTPALPCALAYEGFRRRQFQHRVSPGTVVYNDTTSMTQLPSHYDLRPAALVITTVVSRPAATIATCDAGHKTLSVDCGVPNGSVLGHSDFEPLHPSEEHLPIQVPESLESPNIGERLYLVPRHVCPTVNNFDHALIIRDHRIASVEPVTARGRETPVRTAAARTV
jgi:D-serine deaminase-like pyridoxal phosphate-dependent protein